jgi:hypothetical protein
VSIFSIGNSASSAYCLLFTFACSCNGFFVGVGVYLKLVPPLASLVHLCCQALWTSLCVQVLMVVLNAHGSGGSGALCSVVPPSFQPVASFTALSACLLPQILVRAGIRLNLYW